MIAWRDLEPGDHRMTCWLCSRGPRDRTLGVTVDHERAVWGCFRCGERGAARLDRDHVRRLPARAPGRPAAGTKREILADWARELWHACSGLAGTMGESYLLARGCQLPPADGDLRFHPALRHPSGHVGPALVALLTDAITCEPRTLHRTWITPTGAKAAVDPPRLLLAGHRKAGAVVRLWPDETVSTGLGIAEGVETALTLAHESPPVWSTVDAGGMAALPPLPGIEALTVAVDADPAGNAAAEAVAARWHAAGRSVYLVRPPRAGADLNDVCQEVPA